MGEVIKELKEVNQNLREANEKKGERRTDQYQRGRVAVGWAAGPPDFSAVKTYICAGFQTSSSTCARADDSDPLGLENLQRVLRERPDPSPLERFPPADLAGAGVYALYTLGSSNVMPQ
jgi:hypothetical protein